MCVCVTHFPLSVSTAMICLALLIFAASITANPTVYKHQGTKTRTTTAVPATAAAAAAAATTANKKRK
jgi:hypothetical protein